MLLKTEADTVQLATSLAGLAQPGDAILLSGPLGAGKSVFARAFLRAFCADSTLEVPSPTYTLVQAYDAPVATVYHLICGGLVARTNWTNWGGMMPARA